MTESAPDGLAGLLKSTRDMYVLGFYSSELVPSACARSLFALGVALKLRLGSRASLKRGRAYSRRFDGAGLW